MTRDQLQWLWGCIGSIVAQCSYFISKVFEQAWKYIGKLFPDWQDIHHVLNLIVENFMQILSFFDGYMETIVTYGSKYRWYIVSSITISVIVVAWVALVYEKKCRLQESNHWTRPTKLLGIINDGFSWLFTYIGSSIVQIGVCIGQALLYIKSWFSFILPDFMDITHVLVSLVSVLGSVGNLFTSFTNSFKSLQSPSGFIGTFIAFLIVIVAVGMTLNTFVSNLFNYTFVIPIIVLIFVKLLVFYFYFKPLDTNSKPDEHVPCDDEYIPGFRNDEQ